MPASTAATSAPAERPDSSIKFYGSQVGGEVVVPLSYTGSPLRLLISDIKLAFKFIGFVPFILLPISPHPAGALDELYASAANLWAIAIHVVLFIVQGFFLLTVPAWLLFPLWMVTTYFVAFLITNTLFCVLLNGLQFYHLSDPDILRGRPEHQQEQWIFHNGVAAGRHWLLMNINRVSLTFGRPVIGVHNKTHGVLFDIIQCLIQRNFYYATTDVRYCYELVKKALYSPVTKVVFILHSQGGIEGGMVIDWLLQEVPQDLLWKLEVYTFACAANHFNNPHRHIRSELSATDAAMAKAKNPRHIRSAVHNSAMQKGTCDDKVIRYIEHYAHSADLVSRIGVLHFTNSYSTSYAAPRYMGRVFERQGRGHLFNQHYLNNMFPLDKSLTRASDESEFMEMMVVPGKYGDEYRDARESLVQSYCGADWGRRLQEDVIVRDVNSPVTPMTISWPGSLVDIEREPRRFKVKDLSRLWLYRNGGSPPEEEAPENGHLARITTY